MLGTSVAHSHQAGFLEPPHVLQATASRRRGASFTCFGLHQPAPMKHKEQEKHAQAAAGPLPEKVLPSTQQDNKGPHHGRCEAAPQNVSPPSRSSNLHEEDAETPASAKQKEGVSDEEFIRVHAPWNNTWKTSGLLYIWRFVKRCRAVRGRERPRRVYLSPTAPRTAQQIFAHCRQSACQGCTNKVKAVVKQGEDALSIFAKGAHGRVLPPSSNCTWTVAEINATQKHCKVRCSPRQLSQYVTRLKKSTAAAKPSKGRVAIAQLSSAAKAYQMKDNESWESLPLNRLVVLPDMVASEDEICIIWTCRGMLCRAKGAQKKVVRLVVDGSKRSWTMTTQWPLSGFSAPGSKPQTQG